MYGCRRCLPLQVLPHHRVLRRRQPVGGAPAAARDDRLSEHGAAVRQWHAVHPRHRPHVAPRPQDAQPAAHQVRQAENSGLRHDAGRRRAQQPDRGGRHTAVDGARDDAAPAVCGTSGRLQHGHHLLGAADKGCALEDVADHGVAAAACHCQRPERQEAPRAPQGHPKADCCTHSGVLAPGSGEEAAGRGHFAPPRGSGGRLHRQAEGVPQLEPPRPGHRGLQAVAVPQPPRPRLTTPRSQIYHSTRSDACLRGPLNNVSQITGPIMYICQHPHR
mmetsp:Transcript_3111/g.7722  ORF Transcript_3111/g.7722 Transcript_3111/m.7722 type:complete len:275 (+) Transcript_3111:273-1097(+)